MSQNGDHARTLQPATRQFNLMDWIPSPKKFVKGHHFGHHVKLVKRFLTDTKAPTEYHLAILINSLDEECQLELFANPRYDDELNFEQAGELMMELFDAKRGPLAKFLDILEQTQEPQETASEFLSKLRVFAFRLMGDSSSKQREECVLPAFLNGLRNRTIAKAVQAMNPGDAEEALKMTKEAERCSKRTHQKEMHATGDCFGMTGKVNQEGFQRFEQHDRDLDELKRQVQFLSQQVTFLTSKLNHLERERKGPSRTRAYAEVARNNDFKSGQFVGYQRNQARRQQPVRAGVCWNCNGNHLLRDCTRKITCNKCNMTGHVGRFCGNANAIRYLHEERSDGGDKNESAAPSFIEENETNSLEDFDTPDLLAVDGNVNGKMTTKSSTQKRRKQNGRDKAKGDRLRHIEEWVSYINGHAKKMPEHAHLERGYFQDCKEMRQRGYRKPVNYSRTVISQSRSEEARNKPLVMGKCGSSMTPILIDSGAGLNVIDESFVNSLSSECIIRRNNWEGKIRCANDQVVRSKGNITLMVKIGSFIDKMVFSIMPNLFPKVIIGLRQMKASKMVIDPPHDSLWIENERVQFISKTESVEKVNM